MNSPEIEKTDGRKDSCFPALADLAHDVPERLVEMLSSIAGMFANDALPKDKVKALQAVEVDL